MRNLIFIMAAGRCSRLNSIYTEEEPIKPLIKYKGKTLFEHVTDSLKSLPFDRAVLSFDSKNFEMLDKIASEDGFEILKQKAFQGLPMIYILARQYHLSCDSDYLKGFDNILMVPSDVLLEGVDMTDFYNFHLKNFNPNFPRQVSMLSIDGKKNGGKADFLKIDGVEVKDLIKRNFSARRNLSSYIASYQAGVHWITKDVFSNPIVGLIRNLPNFDFNYTRVLRYETQGSWKNFGCLEDLLKVRR